MNRQVLEDLKALKVETKDTIARLLDDEELYFEYLEQFPDNQNIIKLREAIDAKDYETAIKEVHTLKGIGLNLGMIPFVDVCMDMLLDFRDNDTSSAQEQMDAIQQSFDKLVEVIKKNV